MRISWRTTTFGLALLSGGGNNINNNKDDSGNGRYSMMILGGGGGGPGLMVVRAADGDDDTNTTNTTTIPTDPPEPNDCDKIEIGSIYFFFLNSVDPDEVGLFPFEDLPGNLELYLTDNAWTGTKFQSGEGTLQWVTPEDGIPSLQYFGMGEKIPYGQDWTTVGGSFSLSPEGEQVFLYCFSADSSARPLTAISYNGEFQQAGLPMYDKNESALPTELADNEGAIILPTEEHWVYDGPTLLEKEELRAAMKDTTQWSGGDGRAEFSDSSAAASIPTIGSLSTITTLLVVMITTTVVTLWA